MTKNHLRSPLWALTLALACGVPTPDPEPLEAPPLTLNSFDQWATAEGFIPTAGQQAMLDQGKSLVGIAPPSALPVRHANGAVEVGDATYDALQSGELNYLEDFEAWYDAGLFDPTRADQVREARKFPEVVDLMDWSIPWMDTGSPTEPESWADTGLASEPGPEPADESTPDTGMIPDTGMMPDTGMIPDTTPEPSCEFKLDVVVKSSRNTRGSFYMGDYCSNTTAEYKSHSISGAQVVSDSQGGSPNDGIYWCSSSDSASGTSELEAHLVLVDRVEGTPGDCPDFTNFELQVPVDLYAGIRAQAKVETPSTYWPLTTLLPGIDFKETALAQVSSDGTDLPQFQGSANVTLASNCTTTYSMSGTLQLDNAGASVGVSKTCSSGAINATKSMKAKATSIGSKTLKYNGTSTDTSLTVSADYQTHADSVGCASGSGFFGCNELVGAATVGTERYCLEVEADGFCSVVPVTPGVSCDVDTAIAASMGTCT